MPMKPMPPKIPFFRALFWIGLSTLVVSGSAAGGFLFYHYHNSQRGADPKYNIVALVQTGPEKEQLKTQFLAQLLDLSADKPTNLYHFKTYDAKRKLLASPLIKDAVVKKIAPGTIYVDYVVRKPIAFLGDFDNTAIDADGYLFPFKPYFTPKRIPELYLGIQENRVSWGQRLHDDTGKLAFEVLAAVKKICGVNAIQLKKIDVSKAFSESYGHRQIVVLLDDDNTSTVLRLNTENYNEDLKQYMSLRENGLLSTTKKSSPLVVDLRITDLAFIRK